MAKDTIFISHANPEDNDFVIWLASRLQLLGYKVWVDKEAMLGGEKMWEVIDGVIRNDTFKFLLVYSTSIFQQDDIQNPIAGKLKDGVSKEFNFAETISKQTGLCDFIILMNIDCTDYGLFIGADRLNQISFWANWADGLNQLEKKLRKDDTPIGTSQNPSAFAHWYADRFLDTKGVRPKRERYYSNWWAIEELPQEFYVYRFDDKSVAYQVKECFGEFPAVQIANNLISFESIDSFTVSDSQGQYQVEPTVHTISILDSRPISDDANFPTQRDAENFLKYLLKEAFHLLMKQRKMFWYRMANKKLAYYYTPANLDSRKVTFPYRLRRKKTKTKQLFGRYFSQGNWHYAVSVMPRLTPTVCFSLKNHLAFTTDGFKVWSKDDETTDVDRLHSQRRAKGRRMFNEAWRDLHLAFIEGLKKNGSIEVQLSTDFTLRMPVRPVMFDSDFGYDDPKDADRHDVLTDFSFDDEDGD